MLGVSGVVHYFLLIYTYMYIYIYIYIYIDIYIYIYFFFGGGGGCVWGLGMFRAWNLGFRVFWHVWGLGFCLHLDALNSKP